ncbi:LysR family transcriptional regulator substrate-binding protein [Oceanobacillus jeddahense]|uniref:LysR family transcriptional regulator substrate-binding protein n=2 Tax=Oceanobacillus jeddahense TaxID=1462527 RepID=A0ABY5JT11_9BACI|nr:LysR family transcriptional regulator substrate-binding protein [Oceanobacillus jeddahense]UUI03468.1 LysR family transcriptional regulator substrate-binding protein [Oceanobacillus jeddahense]
MKYYKKYPSVQVIIKTGITEELFNMLKSNQIDLVYTLDNKIFVDELSLKYENEETCVLVTSPTNVNQLEIKQITDILDAPIILTEEKTTYRFELEKILSIEQLIISPFLEIGNTGVIIDLLKKGLGFPFLPLYTIEEYIKTNELKVISLEGNYEVKMWAQIFCHKDKWLAPHMQGFIELVKQMNDESG